jgi:hypothetical protein
VRCAFATDSDVVHISHLARSEEANLLDDGVARYLGLGQRDRHIQTLPSSSLVKVCADPACRVYHPDTPSLQRVEWERIEKEKLATTTRRRILATIL